MTEGTPLVSVVIGTYNQAHWVADALRSAIDQDYPNLEVIAADDASTDETPTIIRELATANGSTRLVPILGDENLGMNGNFNRGLAAAKGKYVAWSAGDDLFLPGKIRAQVRWFEADRARALCGHDARLIDESGTDMGLYSSLCRLREGTGAAGVIAAGVPFPATSVMVRRELVPPNGFDERIVLSSDWKMWIDCLIQGGRYGYVPGVYSAYRMYPGSQSGHARADPAKERAMAEGVLQALAIIESEHPEYGPSIRRQRSKQYAHLAWRALGHGDPPASRRLVRRALRESPRMGRLGWVSLIVSHAPAHLARLVRSDGPVFSRLDPAATTWLSRRVRRLEYLFRVGTVKLLRR